MNQNDFAPLADMLLVAYTVAKQSVSIATIHNYSNNDGR